ncbi:MAG TPA: hypothetical protein VGO11_25225 [Chthoniobacteraceae bacterium]|jgi:hypothetical protein|nr:hypothetical protein [Chthoniobacteraceae bacterium]
MRHHLTVLLCTGSLALANDTSLHDGKFGPEPLSGGESPVRMVAEHIEVSFGYRYTQVHCTFTFRNVQSKAAVEQIVGFPDVGAALAEVERRDPAHADAMGERVNTAPLRKLRTLVNHEPRKAELQFRDVPRAEGNDGTVVSFFDRERGGVQAWHTFKASFPPGKDVVVERIYSVQNGATMEPNVAFFHYTTRTGAPWHGTIGRLQADVTLLDGLTADQLAWPSAKLDEDRIKYSTQPARGAWKVLDKHHLRLVWTDFEPRDEAARRGFSLARPFHGWEPE